MAPQAQQVCAQFRPKRALLAGFALLVCVLLSFLQLLPSGFMVSRGLLAEQGSSSPPWRGLRKRILSHRLWHQGREPKAEQYADMDVSPKVSSLNASVVEGFRSAHLLSDSYGDKADVSSVVTQTYGNSLKRKSNKPDRRLRSVRKALTIAHIEGRRALRELESISNGTHLELESVSDNTVCPKSIFMVTEKRAKEKNHFMSFPCGITVGSSITLIGVPHPPHYEKLPSIGHIANGEPVSTEVSQFMFELRAPVGKRSEEPSRILHINPRLKGDWNDKPVIEINTFLNGQWGMSQRCDGTSSILYHDTVEGSPKCARWTENVGGGKESTPQWSDRLIENPDLSWKYPFAENHSFILTVRAGLEGYHISVDGKHIASFPYTTGLLEELTAGSFVGGDVDVQALIATSLPSLPPRRLHEEIFEDEQLLKAVELKNEPIDLFIGVLSASDHFIQRVAMRAAWFQSEPVKSAKVVTRFFVAMHADKNVNRHMQKEADHFGDMVILPFMDDYNLVVLKTLAICDYSVHNVSTTYMMKCDDDTYVRVDALLNELKMVNRDKDLYMGNMNMLHRPLRTGKWAVTFEEWPDEVYPTYANGLGYIISTNIARFITSEHQRNALELFKMEDVSMGLWVRRFQEGGRSVHFADMRNFYQARCEDGYIVAHYQSPRQMLCMHKKLLQGEIHCCN